MPERSKRLRIMAGPNGSGKSTVLRTVRNSFYSGLFVNADEIEKSFREKNLFNPLAEYSLEINEEQFTKFITGSGKSWQQKAKKEGSKIGLHCKNGILISKENASAYDAALDLVSRKAIKPSYFKAI